MTSAPLIIDVPKKDVEPIPFKFSDDKHVYQFMGAKLYGVMAPMLGADLTDLDEVRELRDWVFSGLSKSDRNRIEKRLLDPKDSLDISELGDIAMALIDRIAERPTM